VRGILFEKIGQDVVIESNDVLITVAPTRQIIVKSNELAEQVKIMGRI